MPTDSRTDNVSTETVQDKTIPFGEYQNLQRKFERERQARIKAERQLAERSVDNPSTRTEDVLTEVLGVLPKAVPDAAERLAEVGAKFKTRREREKFAAQRYAEITELVEANDLDWEHDERFTKAREQWDSGQLDEAIRSVRQVIDDGKKVDVDALVEAKVSQKLKELGRVDTGTSTAANVTPNLADLLKRDTSRMTREEMAAYDKQLSEAYQKQTGVRI